MTFGQYALAYTGLIFDFVMGALWPSVAIIFFVTFKRQIELLLGRLKAASTTSLEFHARQAQRVGRPRLIKNGSNALIALQDLQQPERGDKANADDGAVRFHGDNERKLLVNIAELELEIAFERAYTFIFGSQIQLLRNLVDEVDISELNPLGIFERAKDKDPEVHGDCSFRQWLSFTNDAGMTTLVKDDVYITDFGKAFLAYLDASCLPEDKPF